MCPSSVPVAKCPVRLHTSCKKKRDLPLYTPYPFADSLGTGEKAAPRITGCHLSNAVPVAPCPRESARACWTLQMPVAVSSGAVTNTTSWRLEFQSQSWTGWLLLRPLPHVPAWMSLCVCVRVLIFFSYKDTSRSGLGTHPNYPVLL